MKKHWQLLFFGLFFIILLSGCKTAVEPAVTPASVSTETPLPAAVYETVTPSPTETTQTELSPTITPTYFDYETMACYSDELPYAWEESAAVLGWKYFAEREAISYRTLYFPAMCSAERIERDLDYLLYHYENTDETLFIMLEETYTGTLGQFYTHLAKYDFWAMGSEDYPMILQEEEQLNPNLIFFRVDRMNGEGWEGNEILGIMVGMGEHEYIHTVQATNHPGIAFEIWTDPIYQACVEFYANLNNNSGQRYYRAPSAYLSLIQMLDGLLQMGDLESSAIEILEEMDLTLEEFLAQEHKVYDTNIQALMVNMAGNNYLAYLEREEFNGLLLATWAGLGDPVAYELVREVYDRHISDYNLWYYGGDTTNYLPETFDELFRPYD